MEESDSEVQLNARNAGTLLYFRFTPICGIKYSKQLLFHNIWLTYECTPMYTSWKSLFSYQTHFVKYSSKINFCFQLEVLRLFLPNAVNSLRTLRELVGTYISGPVVPATWYRLNDPEEGRWKSHRRFVRHCTRKRSTLSPVLLVNFFSLITKQISLFFLGRIEPSNGQGRSMCKNHKYARCSFYMNKIAVIYKCEI